MQAFLCACQRQDACVFEICAHLQELRRRLQADYLDPATRFKFAAWEEQRDFGLLAATEDERDTQTKSRSQTHITKIQLCLGQDEFLINVQ